ncbi:MAG TPA: hypothetical protein VOA87_04145 [Thermoanaerobaculia bacterium]|nr:hypothetical protein [Thermoanaerobaculia bacterium]
MSARITSRLFLIVCLLLASGALAAAHAEERCAVPDFLRPVLNSTASNALPLQDVDLPWRPAANCPCLPGGRTSSYSASGANCTAVDNGIFDSADVEATSDCSGVDGVCFESAVIYTNPCAFVPSKGFWFGTGYIRYRCAVCR